MSQGWTSDIEDATNINKATMDQHGPKNDGQDFDGFISALSAYEEAIQDTRGEITSTIQHGFADGKLQVESQSTQEFLAAQLEALDRIRSTGEAGRDSLAKPKNYTETEIGDENSIAGESRVSEHIGTIQCNLGGIQVDADDMVKQLKDRQSNHGSDVETPTVPTPDGKSQNEALASFFAGLVKRGGGTAASSPKPGGI